jgi:hypothetical protein
LRLVGSLDSAGTGSLNFRNRVAPADESDATSIYGLLQALKLSIQRRRRTHECVLRPRARAANPGRLWIDIEQSMSSRDRQDDYLKELQQEGSRRDF